MHPDILRYFLGIATLYCYIFHNIILEKEMATHSSMEIPWTEEPGGLQSMESKKSGQNWVTEQQQT